MSQLRKQAEDSLARLVEHVYAHQNGFIDSLTYKDIATRIGRLNKHGEGHGHGMGKVLGEMGHLLQGLEGAWGEPIPRIQSLVVMGNGPNKGLPDDGFEEFWPHYPQMTRVEKENHIQAEYQRILAFGSRWNDVLIKLGLQPVNSNTPQKWKGTGGESDNHKELKEYIKNHPEIVGATIDWKPNPEFVLPSLDQIDVVFMSEESCIAVEVKSAISDSFPVDYERGLYQTIKYHAILTAMAKDNRYKIPQNIRSLLVLESKLPQEYRQVARKLDVEVIENIRVDK